MTENTYYIKGKIHLMKTKNEMGSDVYVKFCLDAFNKVSVFEYSTFDLKGYAEHELTGIMKDTLKKIYTIQQMKDRLSINIISYNKVNI